MAIETKEITFEREIEYSLLDHGGYIKGNPRDYNREFAVDTKLLFRFLQESQPAEWAKLCKKHGDDVETGFLKSCTGIWIPMVCCTFFATASWMLRQSSPCVSLNLPAV